ncbi:MAG: hypothetical protein EPN85_05835 [Bacteroidetes bacterium]|nr:MAG: hypothetical protein EPN85_05835 [Bacteroidota bacterium]
MKKLKLFIALFFTVSYCLADYTGTVTTNQNDLNFSKKDGYDVLSLKDKHFTKAIGAPEMPAKTLSILIPIDKKVSSIVINSSAMQQISGAYNIYPVQKPMRTGTSPDSLPFENPDQQIYNSANPYPGMPYKITNDGYPMGYHVVTIEFYPVQYIPANKIVNLYTSIIFTIVYANNTNEVLRPNMQSEYSNNLSKTHIRSMVANPDDLNMVSGGAKQVVANGSPVPNIKGMNSLPASNTNGKGMQAMSTTLNNIINIPDYIIITSNALASSFQPLADWKIKKGVYTMVVTIEDIYSNYHGIDNAERIRNYLKDVYVNFGFTYVLLGGDVKDDNGDELIPTRLTPILSNISHATNFYYATVQRDWNQNGNAIFGEGTDDTDLSYVFFVGRTPVRSTADATNFSNKIIGYETLNNTATKSYVNNLSFWTDDVVFGSWLSSALNTLQSNLLPSPTYSVTKLYQSTSNLTHNNAMNVMNAGNHIIYHLDHSGFDNMSASSTISEGINPGDMDALTNANYYSIIYTDGCHANDFVQNSTSKHFINNAGGGGVAFLGNTDDGYAYEYNYFEDDFMEALYNTGTVNSLPAYKNERYHIGYLNWYSANGVSTRLKNRNLLGDPEMMVWSDVPKTTLTVTPTYSSSAQTLTVSVSGISVASTPTVIVTATIWKGTEIYQTHDIIATSTSATYTFSNVVAHTTGNIFVTATAHNYVPVTNTVTISTISGSHPYMTSYTIDDNVSGSSNGNNDAQADAGETIELPMVLTNSGTASSTSVTVTLACTNTLAITMGNSSSAFGNIAASGGTSNNNSNPFVFTVNKTAFNGLTPRPLSQFINFTYTVSINGTMFSTNSLVLEIAEPNLIKGENTVTGSFPGSGTSHLTVKLYNTGLAQATGLNATLTATNPGNTTVTSSSSAYSSIDGVYSWSSNFGSNTSAFDFDLASTYSAAQTFSLSVTNTYSTNWTFGPFNLSVPVINTPSSTITHNGYLTSIKLRWTTVLTPTVAIQGYNVYRLNGTYQKVNTNLIPYSYYLDEGLNELTAYYYKVTAVDVYGNESALFPASGYMAFTSLPIHGGWPVEPMATGSVSITGRAFGSPIAYDLFGDGSKQIFFTTGDGAQGGVWAFKEDASRWYWFDNNVTNKNGYINLDCKTQATPAISDIDNDGTFELGVTTDYESGATNPQSLLVYNAPAINYTAPTSQTGFPVSIPGWKSVKGPVFSDLNNDGISEILVTNLADNSYGGLKVYKQDGSFYNSGWSNTLPGTGNCGFSMPVAFDFNNDGKKEIAVGCTTSTAHSGGIYIFKEDGTNYGASNPVYTPASGYRTDFPPVVADIDNDGAYEILFIAANTYTANIYAMKPDGTLLSGWDNTNHPSFTLAHTVSGGVDRGTFCPSFSVGDIDKDGYMEIVCGDNGHLYVWGHGGSATALTHITFTYPSSFPGGYFPEVTYQVPVLADIDNDPSDLEIIIGNNSEPSSIHAFKIDGSSVSGFPITLESADWMRNTPCVDDINNDGKNELIVTTLTRFYVWDSQGDAKNNVYGWTSYRHDNYNSGVFYSMDGGLLSGMDAYLQNVTISTQSNNMNRYYFGQNILAGYDVTTKKTNGDVIFTNGTNVIIKATNSALLKNNVTVPVGCTFEIK